MTTKATRLKAREEPNGSALRFAADSVGVILRQNVYVFLTIITLLELAIVTHVGRYNGIVCNVAVGIPTIVTCCRLLRVNISLFSLRAFAVGICWLVYVAVASARVPMWAIGHGRAETLIVQFVWLVLALWISVKIEGAALFCGLKGMSITDGFRRSWSYFSGTEWWYWFAVSLCIEIPVILIQYLIGHVRVGYPFVAAALVFMTYIVQTSFSMPYLARIVAGAPD